MPWPFWDGRPFSSPLWTPTLQTQGSIGEWVREWKLKGLLHHHDLLAYFWSSRHRTLIWFHRKRKEGDLIPRSRTERVPCIGGLPPPGCLSVCSPLRTVCLMDLYTSSPSSSLRRERIEKHTEGVLLLLIVQGGWASRSFTFSHFSKLIDRCLSVCERASESQLISWTHHKWMLA